MRSRCTAQSDSRRSLLIARIRLQAQCIWTLISKAINLRTQRSKDDSCEEIVIGFIALMFAVMFAAAAWSLFPAGLFLARCTSIGESGLENLLDRRGISYGTNVRRMARISLLPERAVLINMHASRNAPHNKH